MPIVAESLGLGPRDLGAFCRFRPDFSSCAEWVGVPDRCSPAPDCCEVLASDFISTFLPWLLCCSCFLCLSHCRLLCLRRYSLPCFTIVDFSRWVDNTNLNLSRPCARHSVLVYDRERKRKRVSLWRFWVNFTRDRPKIAPLLTMSRCCKATYRVCKLLHSGFLSSQELHRRSSTWGRECDVFVVVRAAKRARTSWSKTPWKVSMYPMSTKMTF